MIVRCEFEKHEPVRNVTALAVMWYCCNFLSSCRTDGMIGMDGRVPCHLTPPAEMPYLLLAQLSAECLRALRTVNRTNVLARRYGWRRRWLPLPLLEPLPYPEWRAWCADPTKPDAGYESMKARGLL